jgi:hypothetical protein
MIAEAGSQANSSGGGGPLVDPLSNLAAELSQKLDARQGLEP